MAQLGGFKIIHHSLHLRAGAVFHFETVRISKLNLGTKTSKLGLERIFSPCPGKPQEMSIQKKGNCGWF